MNDNEKYLKSFEKFKDRMSNLNATSKDSQPMSDEYKAYIDKVNTPTLRTPTKEEIVKEIWHKLNRRSLNGSFKPSDKQTNLMNYLFAHFAKLGKAKGILLSGSYGVGKTELMKAFSSTRFFEYDYLKSGNNIHLVSSIEMVNHYNKDKNFDKYFGNNLYIDDFGREQRADYMAKDDEPILCKFLETWYITRGNFNLYITTNLDAEEIHNKYGGVIYSRLSQLCEFKKIDDKDFRMI